MKPVKFKECNITFAKDQIEYIPLPAYIDPYGMVTTRWKFSFIERLQAFFFDKIYLKVLTFNQPLQPIKLYLGKDKTDANRKRGLDVSKTKSGTGRIEH